MDTIAGKARYLCYDSIMIRTRNFFLVILFLAFLLGGIVLTLWFTSDTKTTTSYRDMLFGTDTATMTAEVATPADDKQSRLEALRKKLATFTNVAMAPTPSEVEPEPNVAATSTESNEPDGSAVVATVQRCANYRSVNVPQLTGGLTYQEAGGQRTFFVTETVAGDASSTALATNQKVVFTLPLRSASLGVKDCLTADIVAVTPTGLPIRNSDVAAYSGSGESTLIGYTIDGLTLFGKTSSIDTDECGGATVGGVYRYYVSPERKTLINCFVAIPVAL